MRAAIFGLLVVTATLLASASALAAEVARFALVIGNNRAEPGTAETLRYADDDAVATHRLLTEAAVESVLLVTLDADTRRLNPTLRPDGAPRFKEVERHFAVIAKRLEQARERGQRAEFLFFFSGHGDVEGGEGYVVLDDGRWLRSNLFSMLTRSAASTNHVVIDACKSYFLAFGRGPGGRRRAYTGADLVDTIPAQLANTGFVLSSSSERDSHEWERYQGGILSHQLRSALRGAADVNRDGRIDYAELGAFLATANASIENTRFRPEFVVRPPRANIDHALLTWRKDRPTASLSAPGWGHFYVENARGQRLLDAHPASTQVLGLWLPDERPLFVRRHDEKGEHVIVAESAVHVGAPTPSRQEIARRGALHLALEQLFAVPFDEARVVSFRRTAELENLQLDRAPAKPETRRVVQTTAAIAAAIAGTAGLTLTSLAAVQSWQARDASQVEVRAANERIDDLHRASIPCYTVAALASVTWVVARFWPDAPVQILPGVASRTAPPAGLTLGGSF